MLGVIFTDKTRINLRQNLLLSTGFFTGLGISISVLSASLGVIFGAAFCTLGVFAAFSTLAFMAKKDSWLKFGGPLFACLIVVFMGAIGTIALPALGFTNPALLSGLYNLNVYGGVALFSLFVAYDTQTTIASFRDLPPGAVPDHVSPALNMFINLIALFVRFLEIFKR